MKKIIILIACALSMSSSAFAVTSLTISANFASTTGGTLYGAKSGAATTSPLIGKTSTGVGVAGATATTGYALMTQHKSGIKAYGSSFDSTSIFQATTVAGTPFASPPTTANSAIFVGNGWTTM